MRAAAPTPPTPAAGRRRAAWPAPRAGRGTSFAGRACCCLGACWGHTRQRQQHSRPVQTRGRLTARRRQENTRPRRALPTLHLPSSIAFPLMRSTFGSLHDSQQRRLCKAAQGARHSLAAGRSAARTDAGLAQHSALDRFHTLAGRERVLPRCSASGARAAARRAAQASSGGDCRGATAASDYTGWRLHEKSVHTPCLQASPLSELIQASRHLGRTQLAGPKLHAAVAAAAAAAGRLAQRGGAQGLCADGPPRCCCGAAPRWC